MSSFPMLDRRCSELHNNSYRGSVLLSDDSASILDIPLSKAALALIEVV